MLGPPIFIKITGFEAHPDQGGRQASLYLKLCSFRWINTAVVTTLVTAFAETIADDKGGLILKVHAVLRAEIITAPLTSMLDIAGNFKRHIVAPRAANQYAMNKCFRGSAQSLGEKYTSMTKLVLLCFFYSVIFPASFYFGAIALSATYMTDKFLLLRSWAPLPQIGNDVAKLSRHMYFPLALVVLSIMSMFYWSGYPFDNICDTDVYISEYSYAGYIGTHSAVLGSDRFGWTPIFITVGGDTSQQVYRFCNQNFLERLPTLLDFFTEDAEDWMSSDQILLVDLYGYFAIAIILCTLLFYFRRSLLGKIRNIFKGTYRTDEKDSKQRYSDQENIRAYIPQIRHPNFDHPLIACSIDGVNTRHIGWSDPKRDHSRYSMSKDIDFILNGEAGGKPRLNIVRNWPSTPKGSTYGSC